MRPLRVVHVLWDIEIGGNRTETLALVRHADRSRVEPSIFYGIRPGIVRPEEVDALGGVGFPIRRKYDRRWIAALAEHSRGRGADVLHAHNFNGHAATALVLRGLRPKPVFVGTFGGVYRPARSSVRNEVLYLLYRAASYASLRRADGVIAVSRAAAATLRRHGVPDSRIRVIPHGVEALPDMGDGAAARGEFGIPPDAPLVVTVGRLDPMKGHACLLEAAAEVRRHFPSARFLLVGGGPLAEDLRARARALGLEGAVLFAGVRNDVPRLLRAADLFAFPSLDEREGFGIALLEAMACGLPVVASRAGGIPEIVPDGRGGLLVPPRDARALAGAIRALLGDPSRRAALGREGRRRVEDAYSIRACVAATEDFYEECVRAQAGRRG